ncbi:MAG: sensor histidine kinase [Acutalibacteraceae bacterium]
MNSIKKLWIAVIVLIAVLFAVANITVTMLFSNHTSDKAYRVEVNRISLLLEKNEPIDLSDYEYITHIEKQTDENKADFYKSDNSYVIASVGNDLYRLEYTLQTESTTKIFVLVNVLLGVVSLFAVGLLLWVSVRILKPFQRLRDVPYELSKGNLTVPLSENKNRYFGKFTWGLDMLRVYIEKQKQIALKEQRDKKTLVLSLSHDIKTPLSVIELYAKALERNLYKDENKQKEVAAHIVDNCNEIKKYVSEIVSASFEEAVEIEVSEGMFYLSELVEGISTFYAEKLKLLKTEFTVGNYANVLLNGDKERSIEAVQNIIENAIKYGDGKKIAVSFLEEDGCILVTVINSGCTLSENELPHVFESFWRGSNVGTHGGNGLGLYICRQIARKQGGDLFAEILPDNQFSMTFVIPKS